MVNSDSEHGLEADIWSAGVILCVLLTGGPPFSEDVNEELIIEEIRHCNIDYSSDDLWGHLSSDARDLISKMLNKDPKQRISAENIMNHRWIREDGVACEKAMPISVVRRMARYRVCYGQRSGYLMTIMATLSKEEVEDLKEMFEDNADTDGRIALGNLTSLLNGWGLKLRWKPQFSFSEVQFFFRGRDNAISYQKFVSKITKNELKAIMDTTPEKEILRLKEMIKESADTDCRITFENLTWRLNEWGLQLNWKPQFSLSEVQNFFKRWDEAISYEEFESEITKNQLKAIMDIISEKEITRLKEMIKDSVDTDYRITLENLTSGLNEWGLKLNWKPQFSLSEVQWFFKRWDEAISYEEFESKLRNNE